MTTINEALGKGWRLLSCGCVQRWRIAAPHTGDKVMCGRDGHGWAKITGWRAPIK